MIKKLGVRKVNSLKLGVTKQVLEIKSKELRARKQESGVRNSES